MKKFLLLDVGGVIILDSKSETIRRFAEKHKCAVDDIYGLLEEKVLAK